jgi:hypothetical protein
LQLHYPDDAQEFSPEVRVAQISCKAHASLHMVAEALLLSEAPAAQLTNLNLKPWPQPSAPVDA